MNHIAFIKHCFKNFKTAGTIARSSKQLCRQMVNEIDFDQALHIVELGAGDGVLTKHILKNMRDDAKLISFEINDAFCELLHTIDDDRLIVVQDSAEHIEQYIQQHNIHALDAVISALPFIVLPSDLSKKIVQSCHQVLKKNGFFIQMHYSLTLKKMYQQIFGAISIKFVALNLPPAYVLSMVKE